LVDRDKKAAISTFTTGCTAETAKIILEWLGEQLAKEKWQKGSDDVFSED
jgi:hypothetical protein